MNKTVAYLRVSTADQSTDKFQHDILKYANDHEMGTVTFVEEKVSGKKSWKERELANVVTDLQSGDRLLVPELSRLGRSTLECLEILNELKKKDVSVFSIKENFKLNGDDVTSKVMVTMLSLFSELEHQFISLRTKEALAARRASGKPMGRPCGPGKSKLDKFKPEIEALLRNGSSLRFCAKRYNCSPANLSLFCRKHKIDTVPKP